MQKVNVEVGMYGVYQDGTGLHVTNKVDFADVTWLAKNTVGLPEHLTEKARIDRRVSFAGGRVAECRFYQEVKTGQIYAVDGAVEDVVGSN
jgi:hypothetical protein